MAIMRHVVKILYTSGLFISISLNPLISQTLTKKINPLDFLKSSPKLALSPFILLEDNCDSHIILVEKRSQRLYVLNKCKDSMVIESSYMCSTGKMWGDKQESGDMKTPEGIYFLNNRIDSSALPPKYGAGALVLDYPNGFDKLNKKKGYGIWIHGTNEPERLRNSMDTRGCIILKNEDYIDLAKYIELHKTPVVILDEVQYRKTEYVERDKKETMEFLENWKNNWESKNLDDYINLYTKNFRHNKMNIRAYRSYKKRLFKRYKWIKLRLSNIQIFRSQQYILINFLQEYSADTFSDYGIKQLFLTKDNNSYKIIKENWTEIQN